MSNMHDIERANHALFARLARVADEIDPVPELAYDLGRAAFELRCLDSELVELVHDSAVDIEPLASVRGDLDVRLLSFEAADLDIDLQVLSRGGRRSLVGQIVGAAADVRVETAEAAIMAAVDPHGRFQVDDIPAGRIRLHMGTGGAVYTTSWVAI